MTDLSVFLGDLVARRGLSGDEGPVAQAVAEAFAPLCDDVQINAMNSVIARIGSGGPRIMISAHLDEIGLMATVIEEDGAIRFTRVGGVDPRILPGSRVIVHTEEGPMTGVVGAMPPHLLTPEDRKKNYAMDKLYVDLGFPPARVRAMVHAGTPIALYGPLTALMNGRYAAKTIDDRGGVAMMLHAAELLKGRTLSAEVYFVASSQEEETFIGAQTAAYALAPDIGIAIDVTHGEMPGCEPDRAYPLDKVVLTEGPNIHPRLHKRLMELAAKHRVDVMTSVCPRVTATDAAVMQIARAGVPTALIEMPLKYMHTTVETVSMDTVEEAARLLCAFITEMDAGWEALVCY